MNTYRRFAAAVGSVALNAALALMLTQGAGAAAVANQTVHDAHRYADATQVSHTYTIVAGTDHHVPTERCGRVLRSRAMVAVLLSLIV